MSKTRVITIVVFIVVILGISSFFILAWLDDDRTPPKLPTKSTENMLTITSNGCCFWVENVTVSLVGENGVTVISTNEHVYEHNIFKYEIPPINDEPLSLLVEFRCFYGDKCDFSMQVLEFDNIEALRKTGVLLYFQERDDMYLNAIAGNTRISYKMGNENNRWTVMETPNEVFE